MAHETHFPYPYPLDFAAAWHSCTAQDANHRGDAAVDLAFWQAHAAGYDEHSRAPGYYEATLAAIEALVKPSDTLLDVGAGAGRFALPLARSVRSVTALDHARPMLDLLQQRAVQQGMTNIELVEAAWEEATVEPHDVVLAAWSLYRLPDLLTGMKNLIAATRRTLIIVAGAGHSLRHDPLQRQCWPQADQHDTPMHIYYYGVLWQAGIHAELHIVQDHHLIHGETPQAIARQIAPVCATAAEIDAFFPLAAASHGADPNGLVLLTACTGGDACLAGQAKCDELGVIQWLPRACARRAIAALHGSTPLS